jgi:23S rRNA (uridine2552-2'-O)-methyltransferase
MQGARSLGKAKRRWISERRRDVYHRRAKELGYRSRASFKLLEICRRTGLIEAGDVVLDLGAAPGGWLQVASERVGASGRVLGIDLKPIEPLPSSNASTLTGDIEDPGLVPRILSHLKGKADVVISDASPNLTGIWELDQARQLSLASSSVRIAISVLRDGGALILKAFQGSSFDALLSSLRPSFRSVHLVRPGATRKRSSEIYLVCRGLLPPRGAL